MRAVWSFWTKPWRERRGWSWPTERHHLLAWVLSVEVARRHYADTMLVTDDDGARLLVDALGLEFSRVSTALNSLRQHDPGLWMMGKLCAYRAQDVPFVHIDTDVFLWHRLPERLERAPVLAQNPEPFTIGASHYRPDRLQRLIAAEAAGWIPPEWEWSLSFGDPQRGECCGIAGGNHLEFIHYYADTAMQVVEDPRNRAAWSKVGDKGEFNTLIEQYHLAACVDYHRHRTDSPFRGVEIRYLFSSFTEAFDPNAAAGMGFTHVLASAKQSQAVTSRLEGRLAREYPAQYERCLRCAATMDRKTDAVAPVVR